MQEKIEQFIQAFRTAFETGKLVKCTLSKPGPKAAPDLRNLYLRPVSLKKGLQVAFNYRFKTRDEVKNHPVEEAGALLASLLGASFLNADLLTLDQDYSLQIRQGNAMFSQKKPVEKPAPDLAHNREKQRLLDPAAPWLHALGITGANGEVHAQSQDKWRQINKYLEIIRSLLDEAALPTDLHIADMGSGKGYLTFALYDYLKNNRGCQPVVTGIELRPNLVELCNRIAREQGFEGLHFVAADIADYRPERLDMLIALHACDTATDLALAAGIRHGARVVVAAPCCHKQIRREMHAHNELAPLLRHGILVERQAEIVTDGIRSLLLEAEGFQTKVFEFVSTEHTAKNVMITALRPPHLRAGDRRARREKALAEVEALKSGFGIRQHYLEGLLNKTE